MNTLNRQAGILSFSLRHIYPWAVRLTENPEKKPLPAGFIRSKRHKKGLRIFPQSPKPFFTFLTAGPFKGISFSIHRFFPAHRMARAAPALWLQFSIFPTDFLTTRVQGTPISTGVFPASVFHSPSISFNRISAALCPISVSGSAIVVNAGRKYSATS